MTALPAVGTGHEPAPRVRVSEEPSEYLIQLDVSKVHAGRADGRGDWVRASGSPSRRLLPNPLRRHSSPRSPRARRRSGVRGWRRSVEQGRGSAGGRRPEDRARPPPLEAGRSSPARSAPIAMAAYIAATAATTANESANSRRTEVGRGAADGRRAQTPALRRAQRPSPCRLHLPSSSDGSPVQTAPRASDAPTAQRTRPPTARRVKRPWSSRIVDGSATSP